MTAQKSIRRTPGPMWRSHFYRANYTPAALGDSTLKSTNSNTDWKDDFYLRNFIRRLFGPVDCPSKNFFARRLLGPVLPMVFSLFGSASLRNRTTLLDKPRRQRFSAHGGGTGRRILSFAPSFVCDPAFSDGIHLANPAAYFDRRGRFLCLHEKNRDR